MANETTVQTSYFLEDPQVDECRENVPPEATDEAATSKLKVQVENETTTSFMVEEKRTVSDSCTFSTPLLTRGSYEDQANLTGFQCALTPVLKSLNICNEYQSPEPLKHGNRPHLSRPFSPMSFSTGNLPKSAEDSGKLIFVKDAPVCLIEDECLPEITMLDLTYMQLTTNDSVLLESTPTTSNRFDEMKATQTRSGKNNNNPPELPELVVTTVRSDANRKMGENLSENKSSPAFTGILETEITFLDLSCNSEPSLIVQKSSMDIAQDIPPLDYLKHHRASSELNGQSVAEPVDSNRVTNDDLSNTSVQTVISATESTIGASLEGTREITKGSVLENGETSGQNIEKCQTSIEAGIQPANITCNESSFSCMSAQGAHLSSSGSTSSKNVTSEMQSEPTENSNPVESEYEEVQGSCDTKSTSEVSQQSPKSAALQNNILVIVQPSSPSGSSDFNAAVPISCSENGTLHLQTVNCPKAESEAKAETKSISTNSTFDIYQSSSSEQERSHCEKRCTFEIKETAAVGFGNNTFECKNPQNNDTITLSEVTSSERHLKTLDQPLSSKVCNLTKDLLFEPPKHEGSTFSEPNAKSIDKCNIFESSPPLEPVSGNGCEDKDLTGHLVTDGLSDVSNNQGVITVNNTASTFNLDDTLDLRTDFLITSTPMTNCKKREVCSIPAWQNKPREDDSSKAASNIVYDRKTFLSEAAAKSLHPPSKVASQLSRNKSGIPGRLERVMTGLPIKRPRTQAGPVRNAAASEEPPGATKISNSHNLRSLTAASKLPSSDSQRPQQFSIPLPRAAPGLRPPTRTALVSSSTDKSSGLTVTSTVPKYSQGKKHPLPKGDAPPVLKRKKTETLTSSSNVESTASVCDLSNKVKTLKQPTAGQKSTKTQRNDAAVPASAAESSTAGDGSSRVRSLKPPRPSPSAPLANLPSHGCSKCRELEKELKLKSDEIKRLKEELLKSSKQDS